METLQGTLKNSIAIYGVGLHSGRRVRIDILPAAPDSGITFLRTDQAESREVKGFVKNISATSLSTTIGFGVSSVATIEHLMAAFCGLQIDNARVLVAGSEIPILDGSAALFVKALRGAGIVRQAATRKFLVIKESFRFQEGDKFIQIDPGFGSIYSCDIEYPSRAIGKQTLSVDLSDGDFEALFPARTFCHRADVAAMQARGLALGGSIMNSVVVTDDVILNEGGLRSADEFVRHKLLDCLGDFYLLGGVFVGLVKMNKPGHHLNAKFMSALLDQYSRVISEVRFPVMGVPGDLQQELRVAALG